MAGHPYPVGPTGRGEGSSKNTDPGIDSYGSAAPSFSTPAHRRVRGGRRKRNTEVSVGKVLGLTSGLFWSPFRDRGSLLAPKEQTFCPVPEILESVLTYVFGMSPKSSPLKNRGGDEEERSDGQREESGPCIPFLDSRGPTRQEDPDPTPPSPLRPDPQRRPPLCSGRTPQPVGPRTDTIESVWVCL